ncbi:nuclear transport factor 2 family protein [Stenotrophomonas sp. HITSZ_GD]|uniref:YybH family protein n=1 Tax=Stenotrophomonas sp. HITSZ_GD TaxID=3037248 RepID=UPI00240D7DEA|nr:nuclear transport factor 2 family protein [Stenotrophomonas sp. HITSZ_GD]MDG2525570.1 nuclear transport factor 2 family protein [Stenotrophomonas sp. HITSZ_GD]
MPARTPFDDFLAGYADAVRARDIEAFMALYDPALHVFDMWQAAPLEGLASWRAMVAGWLGGLGAETLVVTWRQARAQVHGDLATGHAVLTFAAQAPDGRVLRQLDNRLSVAMRRSEAGWRVFHEHTSAPVAHDSLRAVLQLP